MCGPEDYRKIAKENIEDRRVIARLVSNAIDWQLTSPSSSPEHYMRKAVPVFDAIKHFHLVGVNECERNAGCMYYDDSEKWRSISHELYKVVRETPKGATMSAEQVDLLESLLNSIGVTTNRPGGEDGETEVRGQDEAPGSDELDHTEEAVPEPR